MKILFICEHYYPHPGGAELLFKNLAERFVQHGHQVTVLTRLLKGTPEREEINGVRIERVPSFFSRYAFTFSAIGKAIKLARSHDLIQTTTFNGAPPPWLAARLTGKPVVVTVHEIWLGKWKEVTGFSWLNSQIHEMMERFLYYLPYDKYICGSQATQRDLLRRGLVPSKVEQIYNGFDDAFWNQHHFRSRRAVRKELGVDEKEGGKKERDKTFVYISWGRPGPSKGFEYLLQAVPAITTKLPQAKLILLLGAANNSMNAYQKKVRELSSFIERQHLQNQVTIITPFSHQELGDYLQAADGVVIPSVAEGFGYTTLEAMAMKKPLVVSDAGSLPEIVGGKYLIFKSKDVQDLANKVIAIASGQWQEKAIPKFTWEECCKRYLQVYDAVLTKFHNI